MKTILVCLFVLVCLTSTAQEISGPELLERSIAFHDPAGNWKTFRGTLHIELTMPGRPDRSSEVTIDLPKQYFESRVTREGNTTERTLIKGVCEFSLNGDTAPSEVAIKEHRGDCQRTKLMRNYYTYLYGLPMKLKDPGTNIHEKIARKTFKGKEYLVLKVTYDEAVGSDTWYFYFDPETHAMEVYQFFKDERKNDGEYILLKDILEVNGIKIPKTRAWYYNSNDGYLGTDDLVKSSGP